VVSPASLANPRALVLREERTGLATKPPRTQKKEKDGPKGERNRKKERKHVNT